MSRLRKVLLSLATALALIAGSVTPVHAQGSAPWINPKLQGVFMESGWAGSEGNVSLSTGEKQYVWYTADETLTIGDVIVQQEGHGAVETYYIATDGEVYLRSLSGNYYLQDTGVNLRSDVSIADYETSYATGPLAYQKNEGYVVGATSNANWLRLVSLYDGVLYGETYIPYPYQNDTAYITAKAIDGTNAEYYLMDWSGDIWSMEVAFPEFEVVSVEKVYSTNVFAHGNEGFYFDGQYLYRTTYFDRGAHLSIYDLEKGAEYENIYFYGNDQEVMALYETNKIATLYSPGRMPVVNSGLTGVFSDDGTGEADGYYSVSGRMKDYEWMTVDGTQFTDVLVQQNAQGALTTYAIGEDNWVYTEKESGTPRFERTQVAVRHYNAPYDYATGPAAYQKSHGYVIALEAGNRLNLTSLFTGDFFISTTIPFPVNEDAVLITPLSIDTNDAVYLVLTQGGAIWRIIIHFPDFTVTECTKVGETNETVSGKDGFYYDGAMIYRTYQENGYTGLMGYEMGEEQVYYFGILGKNMSLRALYEPGVVATLEHYYKFKEFVWSNGNTTAVGVFVCQFHGDELTMDAVMSHGNAGSSLIQQLRYTATIPADISPDHEPHQETKMRGVVPRPRPDLKPVVIEERVLKDTVRKN